MNFKPIFVEGTTLGDTWFSLLWNLKRHGRKYLITKGSYEGSYRLAFDDVSGVVKFPHIRPLSPIMPEGINLPNPTNDEDIEQYFAEYLMDGNIKDNEDYKYATFITGGKYDVPNMFGHVDYNVNKSHYPVSLIDVSVPNQLDWIINHFKKSGFGNEHCWITIGYPESNLAYDIPYTNEQERKTSPCLRGLGFRIIQENKINYLVTKVVYRSWDLYGGWPVNMGGFTLLNEYVAQELGVEPGPLTFTSPSLHCYDFQLDFLDSWAGETK